MFKDDLKAILERYQTLLNSIGEVEQTQLELSPNATLKTEGIRADLKRTLRAFQPLLEQQDLNVMQDCFKDLMPGRMNFDDFKTTVLSPWWNPSYESNRLCREVFHCLFPHGTYFDYLSLLGPEISKIIITKNECDKLGLLIPVLEEVDFTAENALNFLEEDEILVFDHYVVPLSQFTGHRNRIPEHALIALDQALRQEANLKLRTHLIRHPDIQELYSKVKELADGMTLKEALIHFRNTLLRSTSKFTGKDKAPAAVDYALAALRRYIARFPEPDYILSNVKIHEDGAIKTLNDCIQTLIKNDEQCVEEASNWVNTAINKMSNEDLLSQSPTLNEEDKLKLKTEIKKFWQNREFSWRLEHGDFPIGFIKDYFAKIQINTIEQVITLFANISNLQTYQVLLTNPKVRELIESNFVLFLLLLPTHDQIKYFIAAMLQSLEIYTECMDFDFTLESVATEQAAIIREGLVEGLAHLINSSQDFATAFEQLPNELKNDLFVKMSERLPSLIITGRDINPICKHLTETQKLYINHIIFNRLYESDFIKTAADFTNAFSLLLYTFKPYDYAVIKFYKCFKRLLPDFTLTVADFNEIFTVLIRYRPYTLTVYEDPNFCAEVKYYNSLILRLPSIITTARDFSHAHEKINKLNPTLAVDFYNLFRPKFIELSQSAPDFFWMAKTLELKDFYGFYDAMLPRLPGLIHTVIDFVIIYLAFKDHTFALNSFFNKIKSYLIGVVHTSKDLGIILPYLLKVLPLEPNLLNLLNSFLPNRDNFKNIIRYLEHYQIRLLLSVIEHPLSSIVPSFSDFLYIKDSYTEDNEHRQLTTALGNLNLSPFNDTKFANFMKPYLPYLIRSVHDLLDILSDFSRNSIMYNYFPFVINTPEELVLDFFHESENDGPEDFTLTFNFMNPGTLPFIIRTIQDVREVLWKLNSTQIPIVCERLDNEVPHLFNTNNFISIMEGVDNVNLRDYLSSWTTEKKLQTYNINTIEELSKFIQEVHDPKVVLPPIILAQIACLTIRHGYVNVMKALDENFRVAFCEMTSSFLPFIIKSVDDFIDLVQVQFTAPPNFHKMRILLPFIIKTASDFNRIIANATFSFIDLICELMKEPLFYIINKPSDIVILLQDLNVETIKLVYLNLEDLFKYIVKSANDLLYIIEALPTSLRVLINILGKHLTTEDVRYVHKVLHWKTLKNVTADLNQQLSGLSLEEARQIYRVLNIGYERTPQLIQEITDSLNHINSIEAGNNPVIATPHLNSFLAFFNSICTRCLTLNAQSPKFFNLSI